METNKSPRKIIFNEHLDFVESRILKMLIEFISVTFKSFIFGATNIDEPFCVVVRTTKTIRTLVFIGFSSSVNKFGEKPQGRNHQRTKKDQVEDGISRFIPRIITPIKISFSSDGD